MARGVHNHKFTDHIGQLLNLPHPMPSAGSAVHGAREIQKLPTVRIHGPIVTTIINENLWVKTGWKNGGGGLKGVNGRYLRSIRA